VIAPPRRGSEDFFDSMMDAPLRDPRFRKVEQRMGIR